MARPNKASPWNAIDTKIASIRTSGEERVKTVHSVAMDILRHAAEHGDGSRMQHLCMALNVTERRSQFRDWVAAVSPIVVKINPEPEYVDSKSWKKDDRQYKPFNLKLAEAKPWFEFARQTPERDRVDETSFLKALAQLTRRYTKMIADKKVVTKAVPKIEHAITRMESFIKTEEKTFANMATVTDISTARAARTPRAAKPLSRGQKAAATRAANKAARAA